MILTRDSISKLPTDVPGAARQHAEQALVFVHFRS